MFEENFAKIEQQLKEKYGDNSDPWGLDPKRAVKDLKILWPLYRHYFDVKLHNTENIIPEKTYMIVSNHTGQIPIDALLICMAFMVELDDPRFLRPLIERYLTALPFLGRWSSEAGAVLGDRNNCLNLLERNESLLIFPEGVPGIAKSPKDYYRLKPFTKGFIRMALQAKVEILPISVVGAEDFFPYVYHLPKLAKFLKIPALPLSPNLIPLPSPVDIYIGKPYSLPTELSPDALDDELNIHVNALQAEIDSMIKVGLENKRTLMKRIFKK